MQKKSFNLGRVVTLGCLAVAIGLVACAADPGARRTRRVMSEEEETRRRSMDYLP